MRNTKAEQMGRFAKSAKLESEINNNLAGLGYGGN